MDPVEEVDEEEEEIWVRGRLAARERVLDIVAVARKTKIQRL